MSAQELRVRIDEISSEIILQKKLVQNLEHNRSLLQRQLNAVVDPVSRLPLEVSAEIFLQCLLPHHSASQRLPGRRPTPTLFPVPRAHHAPMLFLNICSAWTAIALATPALWSSIQILFPCAPYLLPIWFRRAGTRGMSISLRGDLSSINRCVSDFVWKHAERLKHLELWDVDLRDDDPWYDDSDDEDKVFTGAIIDIFGGTTPVSLPLLETLTVGALVDERERGFDFRQIFQLLRLAPNIIECGFESVARSLGFTGMGDMVVIPTLRRLISAENNPDDGYEILDHLTLPSLETLHIRASAYTLDRFLKRSGPPLRELALDSYFTNSEELREYLHLIPSLERLEMWGPCDSRLVAGLFVVLADFPSLLPNLRSLDIDGDSPHISDDDWKTVVRGVTTRRIQLRVHLYGSLSTDVLASFRKLVADGVQIYIGTEGRNLIDLPDERTI